MFATPGTAEDEHGRWATARCATCADEVHYQDREPRSMRVPGHVVRVAVDRDAEVATVLWRNGARWGLRALDLFRRVEVDIAVPTGGPLGVAAVGSGVIAVLEGGSAAYDQDIDHRPVRALNVVDVVAARVLWREPLDGEPTVELLAELVRISWPTPREAPAGAGRPAVVRQVADGAVVTDDVRLADLEARRASRWWEDDARPRPVTVVEGSPAFDEWAARVQALTGRTPVMKLTALRHADHEIVDHFTTGDAQGREHLVIARAGAPVWTRRPTAGDGMTVELVGGAWDPVGFCLEGRWLVAVTEPDLAEFFPVG